MLEIFFECFLLQFIIFALISVSTGDFWFDVRHNYDKWIGLNWFGVWFVTVLYYIVCFPFAMLFWWIRLMTFGRK